MWLQVKVLLKKIVTVETTIHLAKTKPQELRLGWNMSWSDLMCKLCKHKKTAILSSSGLVFYKISFPWLSKK